MPKKKKREYRGTPLVETLDVWQGDKLRLGIQENKPNLDCNLFFRFPLQKFIL